jgi:hypothetical protein
VDQKALISMLLSTEAQKAETAEPKEEEILDRENE